MNTVTLDVRSGGQKAVAVRVGRRERLAHLHVEYDTQHSIHYRANPRYIRIHTYICIYIYIEVNPSSVSDKKSSPSVSAATNASCTHMVEYAG